MATTTPSMGLTVPVLNDPSPGYVTSIANSLAAIDTHDHSPGKGTPVVAAGINVNAALPFNSNSATLLRSTQFANQAVQLSVPSDGPSVYVYGGDLYYLTSLGVPVRITSGASVLLPSVISVSSVTTANLNVSGATSLGQTTFAASSAISQPTGSAAFGGTVALGTTTATSLGAGSLSITSPSASLFRWASPYPYVTLSAAATFEQQATGQVPWVGFRGGTLGFYIPLCRAPKTFAAGPNAFGFTYTVSAALTAAPTATLEAHSFGLTNVPTRVVLAATGSPLVTSPAGTGVICSFANTLRTDVVNDSYYITVTNTDATNYLRINSLFSQYSIAANSQVTALV